MRISTRGDYACRALLSLTIHREECGPTSVRDIAERTGLPQPYLEQILLALKGATAELRELVLSNMSSRAAESLREDLEARGPIRLSEVETQQKEILKIVRRLSDEGQIMIGGGGEEEAFV